MKRAIGEAVDTLLAYGQVDFASNVYLSKIYEAVDAIPGVNYATVLRFRRNDTTDVEIEADGRIEMAAEEIPTLGELNITMHGGIEMEVV